MDYNKIRRKTKPIKVGSVGIGGEYPVSIQSMTNTDTHDVEATYRQVSRLEELGCQIVRITAPDPESVTTFSELKRRGIRVPLVADIHFNYKIAIRAIEAGVDKIRINPGNIGSADKIAEVVKAARERSVPIRIGVNGGSLEKHILEKYGNPTPEALAESALYHASLLEDMDYTNIAISVKSSDVFTMIEANRILARKTAYPLHLGVTEAGARTPALVKSSVGVGALLSEGIGDTVRISLTEDPTEEIGAAREILRSLGLVENRGMNVISCPTCGRTKINLIPMLEEFERRAAELQLDNKNIKVALMGCVVNGPGEAREADVGIAGGVGEGLLFKHGEIIRKIPEENLIDELIAEIRKM